MSDPREVYEKLTNSFWLPTKHPPREQLAFSAAWDYQQLIIDQLRKENKEMKDKIEGLEDMVAGLTAAADSLGQDVYDLLDRGEVDTERSSLDMGRECYESRKGR